MWAPSTEIIRDRNGRNGQAPRKALGDTTALAAYHPSFAGPVRYEAIERPDDDEAATADTVAIMARMVREDSQDPTIRAIAQACASAGGDPVAAIHRWVRDRVTFQADAQLASTLRGFTPADTEVLIRPVDLLRMPQPAGDCDDFAMLTAALLRAAGIPAAFVTVAADPAFPDTYSHVYVRAGRVPVDSSHGPAPGWEAPAAGKIRQWEIDDQMLAPTSKGLGFSWDVFSSIATPALTTTGKIFEARYAVPQLNPGQYIQQGNNVMYQQPSGSSAFGFPTGVTGGGSGSTLLMIGGAVLLVVLMAARK